MAAVAAILSDPAGARALLEIPDAELGRLFKIRLMRIAGLSTALDLDLSSIRGQTEQASTNPKIGSKRGKSARYALIAKGKLLQPGDFLAASGISEQRLTRDLAAGRIFTVDIGADAYYPAFFLVNELDRKALASVVRRLGDLTGWSKWSYFTTPNASLGSSTPLQALMRGDAKLVLRSAAAFVEQRQ
ncbi:hypothetical protein [Paraburkholderia azotifigens]|uniref:DUF2384 domain-containing protein n=1 Tax=Paraburkholderia azotifigens TaxID=2057004 RepID=A0ABU9QVM4_9BURK